MNQTPNAIQASPALLPFAVVSDDGKAWRIEGAGWMMKPEGNISADQARALCEALAAASHGSWIKVGPDVLWDDRKLRVLSTYNTEIKAVVATNTLNGIGGTALHSLAVSAANRIRRTVADWVDVIGCGGIRTRQDMQDFLDVGCVGVQVGTHFFKNGAKVFTELQE